MSGSSFSYLGFKMERNEGVGDGGDLRAMIHYLRKDPRAAEDPCVAKCLKQLEHLEGQWESFCANAKLLHKFATAVEWWASCDHGFEDVQQVAKEHIGGDE